MPTKRKSPPTREEMRKKEQLGLRLLKKGMRAKAVAEDERIQVHPSTVQRAPQEDHQDGR
jgi:hypothetical protein